MIYNITPNDKLNSILNKALESKADKYTSDGGFQAGFGASCEGPGAAVGNGAQATSGGAIGISAKTKTGAAVGMNTYAEHGVALGENANSGLQHIAIGYDAVAKNTTDDHINGVISIGKGATAGNAGVSAIAIGTNAKAEEGIAIGANATTGASSIAIGDGADTSGAGYGIQLGEGQYASQGEGGKMIYGLQVYNHPLMYGNGYIPAARQYVSEIYYIYGWNGNIAQIYEDKNGQGEPFEFDLNADSEVSLYLDEITDEAEQIKLVEVWSQLNLVGVGKQLKAFGLADPSTMLDEAITIPIMIKVVLK